MSNEECSLESWRDFDACCQRSRRRQLRRAPKQIGNVIDELIVRRGYGRFQAHAQLQDVWTKTVGNALDRFSELGTLRRGSLDVIVANSAVMQEFTFEKQRILETLDRELPDLGVLDLRFRVGVVRQND